MRPNDICLVYPPLSVHEFPHLALPLLKGYLSKQGFQVTVKDFNVEIMDEIIHRNLVKVEQYFNERDMKTSLAEIKANFMSARRVLLEDDGNRANRAFKIINTYLRIAGSNIYETCFCPESLEAIKNGYDSIDLDNDQNYIIRYIREWIIPYFKDNPFPLVGISVPFTSQIYYALVIGRELKRLFPSLKVVMGGPQISMFHNILISHLPFREAYDFLIYSQGELALAGLLNCLRHQSGSLESVPNLIYLDSSGKVVINSEKNIKDVNEIPCPDFDGLSLDKYIYGKLPYQISRGCYWSKCEFCSYRNTKGYNFRNLDTVFADIATLRNKYGRRMFHFIDDAIHPNILRDFAQKLITTRADIKYEAYLRLDRGLTRELCHLLKESGLRSVLFGFESANQRILDKMNKGYTLEQIIEVLQNVKEAGIESVISCLIGFPTETREEAWESIRFLKEYRPIYSLAVIVHFGMISDMCYKKDDFGIEMINFNDLIRYDDTGFCALGYPYRTRTGMTVDEALAVIKEGREYLGLSVFKDNFFV